MKGKVELAKSICLSAYLPVRLSICPSVDHPACLSVTLSTCLSVHMLQTSLLVNKLS